MYIYTVYMNSIGITCLPATQTILQLFNSVKIYIYIYNVYVNSIGITCLPATQTILQLFSSVERAALNTLLRRCVGMEFGYDTTP